MEVTEADAEPEVDQEEADQMRDTDAGSKPQVGPGVCPTKKTAFSVIML